LNSEEGPPTDIKAIKEILIVVKQSSVTETPQLILSYEMTSNEVLRETISRRLHRTMKNEI